MEDSKKIKPYISHLNKQLKQLSGEVEKFTSKSLDEQLLLLSDERKKLDLSNKYAYVLSSLCFSYMKVLNVKDVSPIMSELGRCKVYMDKAKELDAKNAAKDKSSSLQEEQAKKVFRSALDGRNTEPAISSMNFQGKHTKFDDSDESNNPVPKGNVSLVNQVVNNIKKQKSQQKAGHKSGKVSKSTKF